MDPRGGSRLTEPDRERLIGVLREHFALGHFEVVEFTDRVGVLLGAETGDQAAAVLDGLPRLPAGAAEEPARSRRARGRHAQVAAARSGWLPTRERFRDPSSGVIMRVWVDPARASRHYVPDERT
ncbi:MAG: DUF1707 SHOCT-like domain-containing protein [Streptosporangiales bacterium]